MAAQGALTLGRGDGIQANVALITAHNAEEGHTYTVAVNQYADLTNAEFKATMTPSEFSHTPYVSPPLPDTQGSFSA